MSGQEKRSDSVHFTSGYADIPLPFGNHPAPRRDETVPEPIRKMREAIFLRRKNPAQEAQNFYVQGKLMSSYEDDYEYRGHFLRFYPTYEAMTTEQLRGYFSWRTKWRRLEEEEAGVRDPGDPVRFLSFAYLHAYELLNNTDGLAPEEGYRKLSLLLRRIGAGDQHFRFQMKRWMHDYVVYYGMDRAYLGADSETVRDRSIRTLEAFERSLREAPAGVSDDTAGGTGKGASDGAAGGAADGGNVHEVFQAVAALSSRDPMRSPFYQKHAADLESAIVRSCAAVSRWRAENGRGLLVHRACGSRDTFPYVLFPGAIFYDHMKYEAFQYEENPSVSYQCTKGVWTCRKYRPSEDAGHVLGGICHEVERLLREAFRYRPKLKDKSAENPYSELIARSVGRYLQEKAAAAEKAAAEEEAARREIVIDLTQLDAIRRDAAETRDQLIVDEEEEGEETADAGAVEEQEHAQRTAAELPSKEAASPASALTALQAQFLRVLLAGGSGKAFLHAHPEIRSAGIFVDAVNEALYDEIGDTVVEFDGDTPELIEDYREEIEALL